MKIEVAGSAGFCFGVDKAVKVARQVLKENGKAYATGDIIHNPAVMEELTGAGLVIVSDISEIPDGSDFIIRAHGEPPSSYEGAVEKELVIHDATCSYVHYIHELVGMLSAEGKKIIIYGTAEHPEIIGINGRSNNSAIIIENEADARVFEDRDEFYCLWSCSKYGQNFHSFILSYVVF